MEVTEGILERVAEPLPLEPVTAGRDPLATAWRMDTPCDASYARPSPEPRAGEGRAMRDESAIEAIEAIETVESIDRARAPEPIRFGPACRWPRMDGPRVVVEARRS